MNTKEQFNKYSKKLATINYGKDGPTPIDLVEEMVDKLPIDWSNPNLRFIDPFFGFGTFLYFSYLRLLKYHDESHILNNMLYGIEIEPFRYELTKKKLKIKNLYLGDSLNPTNKIKEILNMEFDVKLGNPPYQQNHIDGGNQPKAHNSWSKFSVDSFKGLKFGAYVMYVTPISWGSPSSTVFKKFKDNNLLLVNTNIGNHFNGVNSTFSYWLVQKSKYNNITNINGKEFNLEFLNYFQSDINESSIEIHNSVMISNYPKFEWDTDTTTNHSNKKQDLWSDKKSNEYQYKVFHTNAQTYYSKIKSKSHDEPKVFLTISGYYNPKFDNGNISTSEVVPYILVNSKEEGNNLLSILNSKLYRYIVTSAKWSGFLNKDILRSLPKLRLDKKWNDSDIYQEFKLNDELKDYIENYVG